MREQGISTIDLGGDLVATLPARLPAGLTVADVARRYRVSPDKVRGWINRGELRAINTSSACGKPRWVIMPEALAEFERRRAGGPPPKTPKRRKPITEIDYYPD